MKCNGWKRSRRERAEREKGSKGERERERGGEMLMVNGTTHIHTHKVAVALLVDAYGSFERSQEVLASYIV